MTALQTEIEARLADTEPQVEVLLAEVSGSTLRLYIDHPDGVTLAVCERVTHQLASLRDRYALEVSSPGVDRPLTKPQHYSRFLGRQAKVRLRTAPAPNAPAPQGWLVGQTSFTGELVGASEQAVTLAARDGVVAIPYEQIVRSNLVPGD